MTSPPDPHSQFWGQYLYDPIKFVGDFWPKYTLAPYQKDILLSLTQNTETWVYSANEMGKSLLGAMAVIWWFTTRRSKIIVMSSAEKQLKNAMWGEICHLLKIATYHGERFRFDIVKTYLELRYPDEKNEPDAKHFVRLMVAAKGETASGSHLPMIEVSRTGDRIGTIFFLIEEASGLPEHLWGEIAAQRHALLAIGNPVSDAGEYAKVCKIGDLRYDFDPPDAKRLFRKVFQISGDDSPNVKVGKKLAAAGIPPPYPQPIPGILSYEEYISRLNTRTAEWCRVHLFGKFPEEEGQRMFPSRWLDVAGQLGAILRERMNAKGGKPFGRPFALGVDASEGGGDLTSFYVWGRFGAVYSLTKETPNTTEIAGTAIQLMRRFKIKPWYVAFDSGGGGKQIADFLREKGYEEVDSVDFGGRANDPLKYMNKRAELYGQLREAMKPNWAGEKKDGENANPQPTGRIGRMLRGPKYWAHEKAWCASIPPDASVLKEDLGVLPLLRDSEGRLRMLPKDRPRNASKTKVEKCVRELLGRSPDQGDACVLAYNAWLRGKEWDDAASVDGPLIYG